MNAAIKARLLRVWRVVRWPVILVAIYLVLALIFAALTERHGLVSPETVVSPVLLLVAVPLLLLRLGLLFALPAIVAYRLVVRLIAPRRDDG